MNEEGNLVPRTYRLPKPIIDYLDSLPDKSAFVISALEVAIAENRLLNENSVIGRAKAIGHVEDQIAAIEEDETHRDAVKGLRVLAIPDAKIIWLGGYRDTARGKERVPTSKEEGEIGGYNPDHRQRGVWFTREAYDRYTSMGKEYFARIVSDYKTRIQQLVEKRENLKAEILKTSPA